MYGTTNGSQLQTVVEMQRTKVDALQHPLADTVVAGTFTWRQLYAAFAMVKWDANDWKGLINATLFDPDAEMVEAITQAVPFFTGSVPSITKLRNGFTRVIAGGYYQAVGA